jgi:cyclase
MRKIRIIPRLDIKGDNLIKGVHLEGLRVMGDPNKFAKQYYESGADELIYMDSVASLYGRNSLKSLIKKAIKNIFIPITVGGGIRSIKDAFEILSAGADKIAVNTAAVKNPFLIKELIDKFGSQSIVISIEAKQLTKSDWEVYTENGREKTGIKVMDWVRKCTKIGVGEILVTSIDRDGTKKGFDIPLLKEVGEITNTPIIASGGMGQLEDFTELVKKSNIDAVSMATILHYKTKSIKEIRSYGLSKKINLREFNE